MRIINDQQYAIRRLRSILKPGDKLFTILRHVSASGMLRRISVVKATTDHLGQPTIITLDHLVGDAAGYKQHRNKPGLIAHGAGMDMGYDIVYNLGKALWPDGTPEPHGTRNGSPDSDGGYALKHEWL